MLPLVRGEWLALAGVWRAAVCRTLARSGPSLHQMSKEAAQVLVGCLRARIAVRENDLAKLEMTRERANLMHESFMAKFRGEDVEIQLPEVESAADIMNEAKTKHALNKRVQRALMELWAEPEVRAGVDEIFELLNPEYDTMGFENFPGVANEKMGSNSGLVSGMESQHEFILGRQAKWDEAIQREQSREDRALHLALKILNHYLND